MEKKKADASQRLKVAVGHDSRISAQTLQVFSLSVCSVKRICIPMYYDGA